MSKYIPRPSVAEFISDKLSQSDKTQREIAEQCGFEHPNIITMFKNGSTKLPLNRIGALAHALDVDPAHLLRLVMLEYVPDTWNAIESITQCTLLTTNELELIRSYRQITGDNDAAPVVITVDDVLAIAAA